MVTRKVVQMGHVLPRRTPTGEVLERRVQRLRRVRSADGDHLPRRRPAGRLPGRRVHRAEHLSRRSAILILLAAPVLVGAALPLLRPLHRRQQLERVTQLRPHLDGDRHRRRAADPARDRRRAHLRPQLRRAVAARPAGRRLRRHLAGRDRGGRRAVLRRVHRAAGLARHPTGHQRRPDDRPADQLPRLRAVHDLPDPDLLRAGPEGHPGHGVARARRSRSSSTSRRGPTRTRAARCPTTPTCTTSSAASSHTTAS